MPMAGATTREIILRSAKAEFLAHGFAKASLRTISAGAGVTTGALYRHFTDKAALFDALVAPCFREFMAMYQQAADTFMQNLENLGMDWSSSEEGLLTWVGYIYDHLEIFQLLLTAAEKTSYESFVHLMVDMEVKTTLEYLEAAKAKGYPICPISEEEVHMLVSAQFSVLFEMVLHHVPRNQAMVYTKSINRFFFAGWKAFFIND